MLDYVLLSHHEKGDPLLMASGRAFEDPPFPTAQDRFLGLYN